MYLYFNRACRIIRQVPFYAGKLIAGLITGDAVLQSLEPENVTEEVLKTIIVRIMAGQLEWLTEVR